MYHYLLCTVKGICGTFGPSRLTTVILDGPDDNALTAANLFTVSFLNLWTNGEAGDCKVMNY
jgi:hypothetical protein